MSSVRAQNSSGNAAPIFCFAQRPRLSRSGAGYPVLDNAPVFRKSPILLNVVEQVATGDHLHHVVQSVRGLKARV